MKPITLTVFGKPQALKRHRSFQRCGKGIHIDPSKGDKADFLTQAIANKPATPLNEPLMLTAEFYFQRPKGHYGTGGNSGKLKPSAPIWHVSTPDTDNLVKFVCDSLNGIFYKDDSFICFVRAVKQYSDKPRTVLTFERLNYIVDFNLFFIDTFCKPR